jgi:hypothetical protein
MRHTLRNAILASLGSAALASMPTEVSALGGTVDDLQATPFAGTGSQSFDRNIAGYKSFSDYGIANQGWVHKTNWMLFSIGTPGEQAAGTRYDLTISMTGRAVVENSGASAGANQAVDNPGLAVWTAGTGPLNNATGYFHGFSPIRGPNDNVANPLSDTLGTLPDGEVVIINNVQNVSNPTNPGTPGPIQNGGVLAAGVLNGHEGWIGYAQAGPGYTIEYSRDPVQAVSPQQQTASGTKLQDVPVGAQSWFVNLNNPWVDGAASTGTATAVSTLGTTNFNPPGSSTPKYFLAPDSAMDTASLHLANLKAGNYLIALGGSCAFPTPSTSCGQGTYYTVRFDYAPADAAAGTAQSWNLSRELMTAASGDNPHGQWSFRKGTELHKPRTYRLLPYSTPLGANGNLAHASGWKNGETYIGLAEESTTDGNQWTITQGVLFLKPEAETLAVASWRSPITGRVRIAGIFQDAQPGCGNGVKWYIDRGNRSLANGSIADGQGAAFSRLIRVREGQQLHFIVDANGDASCDPTNLDLLISSAP